MAIWAQPAQKSIWAKARVGSDISVANRSRALKMMARAKHRLNTASGGATVRCRRRQQKKASPNVTRAKKADRKNGKIIDKASLTG
jgi:hypothetical protein